MFEFLFFKNNLQRYSTTAADRIATQHRYHEGFMRFLPFVLALFMGFFVLPSFPILQKFAEKLLHEI